MYYNVEFRYPNLHAQALTSLGASRFPPPPLPLAPVVKGSPGSSWSQKKLKRPPGLRVAGGGRGEASTVESHGGEHLHGGGPIAAKFGRVWSFSVEGALKGKRRQRLRRRRRRRRRRGDETKQGGREHTVAFAAAAHNKNRLREQTVETESRRRSALIGFDTNLKRQVATAAAAAAASQRVITVATSPAGAGIRAAVLSATSELKSPERVFQVARLVCVKSQRI